MTSKNVAKSQDDRKGSPLPNYGWACEGVLGGAIPYGWLAATARSVCKNLTLTRQMKVIFQVVLFYGIVQENDEHEQRKSHPLW